jgi:hypothetical protein
MKSDQKIGVAMCIVFEYGVTCWSAEVLVFNDQVEPVGLLAGFWDTLGEAAVR